MFAYSKHLKSILLNSPLKVKLKMKPALCFPTSKWQEIVDNTDEQYFKVKTNDTILISINRVPEILEVATTIEDRATCEKDTSLLQIIPYVVLMSDISTNPRMFVYQRGKGSGEKRLTAKWSIGVGGHIEEAVKDTDFLRHVIARCINRELVEEVGISFPEHDVYTALDNCYVIQNCKSDVDKVHLGLICLMFLPDQSVGALEKDIVENGSWKTTEEIKQLDLEEWSKIYLDN